jgi:hypothetical protein
METSTESFIRPLGGLETLLLDERGDLGRDCFRGVLDLMFPEAEHVPALATQRLSDSAVARAIGLDLIAPKGDVALREILAAFAAMPEASIDEYGYLAARPCEVGLARDWPVLAVAS